MRITHTQMLKRIEKLVTEKGTQAALAREWDVSQVYLSDVLNGRRDPGKLILDKLGLRKVDMEPMYETSEAVAK